MWWIAGVDRQCARHGDKRRFGEATYVCTYMYMRHAEEEHRLRGQMPIVEDGLRGKMDADGRRTTTSIYNWRLAAVDRTDAS
jgi:hypothetical protein